VIAAHDDLDGADRTVRVVLISAVPAQQVDAELGRWARFDFNTGAFCSTKYQTMIAARRLIADGRIKASCAQMNPWVYVLKHKVRGQVLRRARERAMCEAS